MKNPSVDVARSYLADVPKDNAFLLGNGKELLNLEDLELALNHMPLSIFEHHVNESKNDFSNWVLHVIKDAHLAELISKEKSKENMAIIIKQRMEDLLEVIKRDSEEMKKAVTNLDEIKKKLTKSVEKKKVAVKLPPPKPHQYLRNPKEHIHFGINQFVWGFILGVLMTLAILIWI